MTLSHGLEEWILRRSEASLLIQVGLLAHVRLLLGLKVKELCLNVPQCFDLFYNVSCIFVRQQLEEYSFETEALAPLNTIGLRQLAGKDRLARWLRLLSGSRVSVVAQVELSWFLR